MITSCWHFRIFVWITGAGWVHTMLESGKELFRSHCLGSQNNTARDWLQAGTQLGPSPMQQKSDQNKTKQNSNQNPKIFLEKYFRAFHMSREEAFIITIAKRQQQTCSEERPLGQHDPEGKPDQDTVSGMTRFRKASWVTPDSPTTCTQNISLLLYVTNCPLYTTNQYFVSALHCFLLPYFFIKLRKWDWLFCFQPSLKPAGAVLTDTVINPLFATSLISSSSEVLEHGERIGKTSIWRQQKKKKRRGCYLD